MGSYLRLIDLYRHAHALCARTAPLFPQLASGPENAFSQVPSWKMLDLPLQKGEFASVSREMAQSPGLYLSRKICQPMTASLFPHLASGPDNAFSQVAHILGIQPHVG